MDWMERCYSRLLIDNHITDQRPEYMRRFDPEEYVRLVRLSGVEAAMVYACDHNGNCYYPTRVGHQHANLEGRDVFGEVVGRLDDAGIVPIAYYTLIYHNDAARRFPGANVVDVEGQMVRERYRHVCPNAPETVAFHAAQIEEILAYPVQGIFLDMTFWPSVCACEHCRRAFRERAGKEIPAVIDWEDPDWVAFQRFREESMAGFAAKMTAVARARRPGVTVTHQFSPVLHGWALGQSAGIAAASDYASGDFYGGKLQQRFGVKAFAAFTTRHPFEFMTSRCESLNDHTSAKAPEELFAHALTTLANGGAYFFIDAINPDGTLHAPFYETLHELTGRLAPFAAAAREVGGKPWAPTGLYFSMESCVNEGLNGLPLRELSFGEGNMGVRRNAVLDEAVGAAELLIREKIPFRVVTSRDDDWSSLRAVVVNNAAYLSEAEVARLREFVRGGGVLIATGRTSLFDREGRGGQNFALADVFGVDYSGARADGASYLVPWPPAAEDAPVFSDGRDPLTRARPGAEVLARVALPDFPVNDPDRYASIHSNPPGAAGDHAALTLNRFGKGVCVYCYSSCLRLRQHSQRQFWAGVFRRMLPQVDAGCRGLHVSTEITLLRGAAPGEMLIGVVNLQDELPPVPLRDVSLRLRLPLSAVRAVRGAAAGKELPFAFDPATRALAVDLPEIRYGEFLRVSGEGE